MSVLIKRKRGRPRLDESRVINDIDISLVEAYKSCPIFYDKNHPNYRNRECTEDVWKSVASSLNVSVTILKNRMLQLRNRYNVEKRRWDTSLNASSSWPLYDSLRYVCEYNENRPASALADKSNSAAHASSSSDIGANDYEDYEDEDLEAGTKKDNQRNGFISSDKIECSQQLDFPQSSQQAEATQKDDESHLKKFEAFGQFLALSLIDLNEMQALHLVKKFSADLVEYSKLGEGKKLLSTTASTSTPCGVEEDQMQHESN